MIRSGIDTPSSQPSNKAHGKNQLVVPISPCIVPETVLRVHCASKTNCTDVGGVTDHCSHVEPCIKNLLNKHCLREPPKKGSMTPNLDFDKHGILSLTDTTRNVQNHKGSLHEGDHEHLRHRCEVRVWDQQQSAAHRVGEFHELVSEDLPQFQENIFELCHLWSFGSPE